MNLIDFIKQFPDELSCKNKFKEYRDHVGVTCTKCGNKEHYWKQDKEQYECKKCKTRTTLKSGTVMHKSKLPFRHWFLTMHLLTSTKKSLSAKEVQRQLGYKRYQPIWDMVHKLREVMDNRNEEYILAGRIELDEDYFVAKPAKEKNLKPLNLEFENKKNAVLILAESEYIQTPEKGQDQKHIGYVKIKIMKDFKREMIDKLLDSLVNETSPVNTDEPSYVDLKDYMPLCHSPEIPKDKTGESLPWVHIAINNTKRQLVNSCHDVKPEFLQNYLDEFCYKFNKRYYGEALFNKLLIASVNCKNNIRYECG